MTVLHLISKTDYDKVANSKYVVIHFFAEWVEQCRDMNNVLDEMAKKETYKEVIFSKIPAEQVPEVSLKYKITAVPTIVLLQNGSEIERVDGAHPSQLNKKLGAMLSAPQKESPHKPIKEKITSQIVKEKKVDLNERLNRLINSSDIMLFMKGNVDQPRCGFSQKIVDILKQHNATFKTFDILNDEEVREGLKKYSNWPTYPQLYIEGELIGGLDIVKELVEAGEFEEKLPKKYLLEDRLKSLINKSKIMVFMKGDREKPRCGFSRQLIQILNDAGATYETFDILEDEDVRQGLKTFSNWPTYPQVYVKGELIGGLDIIKEHLENGELSTLLHA
ncbi:glutaredoxin 3 [Halyomorpha halys]|uniref:glutaredoxin 3 n=1 Tax=Halyomorpha halys TaxID=286706 RepID=UPI0006D4EBAC|nr:glutaredoxin 3 [Halyomorpha halys]